MLMEMLLQTPIERFPGIRMAHDLNKPRMPGQECLQGQSGAD